MKKWKIAIIVAAIGILTAAGVAYYLFNKPHTNVADAVPAKIFTANDLFNDVKTKDSLSLLGYRDKVLQVNGAISKIEAPADTVINIFLAVGGDGSNNISCAMDPKYFSLLKNLKAGDTLTINGIFSGVNKFEDKDLGINMMDVDLARCVAIRK